MAQSADKQSSLWGLWARAPKVGPGAWVSLRPVVVLMFSEVSVADSVLRLVISTLLGWSDGAQRNPPVQEKVCHHSTLQAYMRS